MDSDEEWKLLVGQLGQGEHSEDSLGLLDVLRWKWLYRSEAQEADLGHRSVFVGHSQTDCDESQSNPNILRVTE